MGSKNFLLPDFWVTLPIILLLSLGILVIYSSDSGLAMQQLIFALIGLVFYWLLSLLDFEYLGSFNKYLYFGVLVTLLIVFVLGIETRGSLRWIPLGSFRFQPSELAKPILILVLANFWSARNASWLNVLKSFLIILPPFFLVFRQPDLGTALTFISIWAVMLIGANLSLVKILVMGVVSILITPFVWFSLKAYQKERVLTFLSPDRDPLGMGYNVIQATIAVGSGQFWGRGLGHGTQSRLRFLPEFRTDFIFASIAEEFGFIGSMLVVILYGILFTRALRIISLGVSRFKSLLIFGVLGMLFFQVVVNIGMNIGVVPVTGITLPLVSYGGSSVVATLISLSFLVSVSKFSPKSKELLS